jgi:hypothetical protein
VEAVQKGCLPAGLAAGGLVRTKAAQGDLGGFLWLLNSYVMESGGALIFVMLTLWGLYKKEIFLRV